MVSSSSSPSVTSSGTDTATPSTSASAIITEEEGTLLEKNNENEDPNNNQRRKNQRTRTPTDYVDISKHLTKDPMADLLTDTHISNFLEICVDYFDGRDKIKKFRFVNPTFFESPYAIEDVTNFVQDFDENISVLFIPVCYHTHWVLFVLRPALWILESYNSLEDIHVSTRCKSKVKRVCEFLFKSDQKLPIEYIKLPKCLQQQDSINCGIFLCVFIEQIIRYGKICNVKKFDIDQERHRLNQIFYEVQRTHAKPSFWPSFSGEPILTVNFIESSSSSEQNEDNNEKDEFETCDEDSDDNDNNNDK